VTDFTNNLAMQSKRILAGVRLLPQIRLSVLRRVFSLMGKTEKRIWIALIVIAIISFGFASKNFLHAYTAVVPDQGGSYTEGIIGEPRFINPLYATTSTDRALVNLIYAGLYRYDDQGNVVPDLATDFPEISEDKKTYTIKLRDAQWHNGVAVTANDVVFTIQTLQNPEYNSPKRGDWLSTTVAATDERTVVFTLKAASGPFLNNLTLPIISEVVWNKVPPADFILSQGNIQPIGNGPYRIKEVEQLTDGDVQSISLESFQNFHDRPSYISDLQIKFFDDAESLLKALHGNQIDGFGFNQFENRVSVEQSAKDLEIHQIPLPQYQALFLNTTVRSLGEARVRQALNLATDKSAILNEVFQNQGLVIESPILAQQVANLPAPTSTTDIAAAKTLLDQAGWTYPENGTVRQKGNQQLKFKLATNDNWINRRAAELLIEQWRDLGIEIELVSMPTRELNEQIIKPRAYDMLLFAHKLGADPDPFVFWHSSQAKPPGLNLSSYANQTVDRLISEARATTNKEERDAKYLELHEVMKQDLPAIFLVQSVYTYALHEKVEGFTIQKMPDETVRFFNLRNWYLETKRVLKQD
jgi:peptide/nickel transport system substrate-binding protein